MSKKNTRALYRWTVDCGRMGVITGLFTASDEDVQKMCETSIYLDEPLGEHSEWSGKPKAEQFERLTDDADFVKKFEAYGCASGYDPRDHVTE